MKRLILVLGIVSGVWACDRGVRVPRHIACSSIGATTGGPAAHFRLCQRHGLPTGGRCKRAALDGPQAGTMTTSDASGHFSYDGTFSMPVTLRAAKDGYATATRACSDYDGRPSVRGFPVGIGHSACRHWGELHADDYGR